MADARQTIPPALFERRTLGWGFEVAPLGGNDFTRVDLVLARETVDERSVLRLREVSGRATLRQDLVMAFCTGRQTDPLNPSFGFDGARIMAEEDDRGILRERLRAAAAVVADADPRVSRIVDVQVSGTDERPAASLAAPGLDATGTFPLRAMQITVIFDTLAGERVSEVLGGDAADD